MKKLLILFLLFISPVICFADTHRAASCSYADVAAAVAAASAGDTVSVPSGTATWANSVTVDKAISIIGAGKANTKISTSIYMLNGFFYITDLTTALPVRISGFSFTMPGYLAGNYARGIMFSSTAHISNMRIDNNEFHFGYDQICFTDIQGVIDNNYFYDAFRTLGSDGNSAMAVAAWNSLTAGASDAMFIEDNHVIRTAEYQADQVFDCSDGGKFVIRYNTYDNTAVSGTPALAWIMQTHGNAGGGLPANQSYWQQGYGARRSPSVVEVYNNTITGKSIAKLVSLRGGANLVYNNVVNCSNCTSTDFLYMYEEEQDLFSPKRTLWPAEDQIFNTFFWGNVFNGSPQQATDVKIGDTSGDFIQLERDYHLHAPEATGGKEVFTGSNGASGSYPTDGDTYPTLGTMQWQGSGANAFYPYTPYTYPHPLRSSAVKNTAVNTTFINSCLGGNALSIITTSSSTSSSVVVTSTTTTVSEECSVYESGTGTASYFEMSINNEQMYFGQRNYTVSVNKSICQVDFYFRNIIGDVSGKTFNVYIYELTGENGNFTPASYLGKSANVTGVATAGMKTFTFSSDVPITTGKFYAIVCTMNEVDASNYVNLYSDNGGGSIAGRINYFNNLGVNQATGYDWDTYMSIYTR